MPSSQRFGLPSNNSFASGARGKMSSVIRDLPIAPDMKVKKASIFLSLAHHKEPHKISHRTLLPVSALIRKAIGEFLERNR